MDWKLHTLKDFLIKNKDMLNILWVFFAIASFSTILPLNKITFWLSFIFTALTIIVWLEIRGNFPSWKANWRLIVFEWLITFGTFLLFIYWLTSYRKAWKMLLSSILFLILGISISFIVSYIFKRNDVFNGLFHSKPNKDNWLRYLFWITIVILIFYLSILLAEFIASWIVSFFDNINSDILHY